MDHHRVWRLRALHRRLDQQIHEAQRQLSPDMLVIRDLKRRKLRVKDELDLLEAGRAPATLRMSHA